MSVRERCIYTRERKNSLHMANGARLMFNNHPLSASCKPLDFFDGGELHARQAYHLPLFRLQLRRERGEGRTSSDQGRPSQVQLSGVSRREERKQLHLSGDFGGLRLFHRCNVREGAGHIGVLDGNRAGDHSLGDARARHCIGVVVEG